MKKLICILIIGIATQAKASVLVSAPSMKEVTPYLLSCAKVTLSDTVPLELTGNTTNPTTTAGVFELMIAPLDAAATAYFSHLATVANSGALIGYPIYPTTTAIHQMVPVRFIINPTQGFYGIASANNTPVMICLRK